MGRIGSNRKILHSLLFFFLTGSGLGTGQAQVGHNSDQAKTVTSTCEKETFSSFQMPQTLCREEDKKQKGRLNDL